MRERGIARRLREVLWNWQRSPQVRFTYLLRNEVPSRVSREPWTTAVFYMDITKVLHKNFVRSIFLKRQIIDVTCF